MKLNLEFDKNTDKYSDGDIENEILNYAQSYDDSNIEDVFKNDIRWPVFYHLTNIRKNIINWYPFKKNSSVLEIGGGMGAITSTLCDKADRVVSVELSKRRASTIATRNNTSAQKIEWDITSVIRQYRQNYDKNKTTLKGLFGDNFCEEELTPKHLIYHMSSYLRIENNKKNF